MPQLTKLFVIHTTSRAADANTDATFQLQVVNSSTDLLLDFPNLSHDQREKGRSDQYEFDIGTMGADSDDPSFAVLMRINGSDDGWLPSSIFVIGQALDGRSLLVGAHPSWPTDGWFDAGSNPGGPSQHKIGGR